MKKKCRRIVSFLLLVAVIATLFPCNLLSTEAADVEWVHMS